MLKPGDDYHCPACGKNSFLRKESVMDGWTKKGEVLKCTACGHVVCEFKEKKTISGKDPLHSAAAERFRSLLGEDEFIHGPTLKAEEGDCHFCKDCAYLIPHPFITRCSRFNKDVNPMEDCPEFVRRKK